MDRIVDQYLNYLNYSTEKLNFMLGDMEFFTGDTNYIKAHELFQSIYDLRIKTQEVARYFRYYKNGKDKKADVLSEILELQKSIFRVEETEDSKIIYNIEPDKI